MLSKKEGEVDKSFQLSSFYFYNITTSFLPSARDTTGGSLRCSGRLVLGR